MKVKTQKWTIIISLFILVAMLISFLPINNIKNFSHAQKNNCFTISVYGRDGNRILDGSPISYHNESAYVFSWRDVEKFVFNIDTREEELSPEYDANRNPYYVVSISIEYFRGYRDNSVGWDSSARYTFENLNQYTITKRGLNSTDELINYKPEFDIDEGITTTTTGIRASAKEWGIYKFKLSINKHVYESDFFIIEPIRDVLEKPVAQMTVTSSESSLRDAYVFSLENEEAYKYVDYTKLTWYAKGLGLDGTKYALIESDVGYGEFTDCTQAIFSNEKTRTGLTFTFEDQGKYGQWEIWCVYRAEGSSLEQESNRTAIETKQNVSYFYIVWIVVALCAVAIAVTVGICIFKNKHERVY